MAPEGRRRAGRGALPKNVKSMSKEVLEATLKKKKECDARALEVVERLLEADVTEEAFLACLPLIQESHFRDVVEERAISALCGYPLCSAPLGPPTAPERKYTINTRLNKVYDITERKNFCSNLCYKSARFVKDQLLTSPLWLRDGEEVPTFTLLPSFASGGPAGEEVDIGTVPSLKEEVEKLKRDGGRKSSLGKKASQCPVVVEEGERKVVEPAVESGQEADRLSPANSALAKSENVSVVPDLRSGSATVESVQNEADRSSAVATSEEVTHEAPVGLRSESAAADRINGKVVENSPLATSGEVANDKATVERIENEIKEVFQVSQLVQTWEGEVHVQPDKVSVRRSDILVTAEATVRPSAKPRPKEGESKVPTKSSVARVEACLEEWVTMETLVLLLGEDAVRKAVTTTGADLKELLLLKSEGNDGAWDATTRETYRNICRRLNLMELEDARYDTAVAREGRELRPLPDYAAVREESLRMQLKVRAFLGGRTGYEVPPPVEGEGDGKEEEGTCYLPLVDRHAKGALRRRMVLDRLSRVVPGLTQLLRLSCRDVTSDLRAVVSTFALEAHNITFKPPEWNLLGLVLLKMISLKNSDIGSALESESARGHAAGILAVFRQRKGYLDGLVAQLVDVQKVLGKRARPSGGGDR